MPPLQTDHSWKSALQIYAEPRIIAMFFLGFAAGLPFPLVFTTLSTWLRDVGIERATIGFFAWIGITYSIKVFWSPVVDRLPLPGLTRRLGQRRGWMLLAQLIIAAGLVGMAYTDPTVNIVGMALFGVLVAFASATQDIVVDAYRIEAVTPDLQGPMAGTYQSGYRIAAALVGGAAALYLAEFVSWQAAYLAMAGCMGIGIVTVLLIKEPPRAITSATVLNEARVVAFLERSAHLPGVLRVPAAWFIGAVVCPFIDFFQRNGRWALFLLVFIALYRISDIVMANMAYPLYIDLGFSKKEIADVAKIFGVGMTIAGALFGGVLVIRLGLLRSLLLGAILVAATNLLFAQLALGEKSLLGLALVISADNFSAGVAGSAFIAFLSRLTNTAYTATQYALFSSLMTLPAKLLSGISGIVVEDHGYAVFFTYAAVLGVPAILLVLYLMYGRVEEKLEERRKPSESAQRPSQ
jgi:PAT family beta-lactamase induction signal transducer AmpG